MTHNSLNKSYTQMCIWVDNNAYKEDVDIDVLFKHLYHIVRCMSLVFHLFKSENDLEDFSTEFAENLLLRYLNPNLSKLKSISNYIHKTIFGVSASFLKKQFSQIVEWDKDSVYSNDIIIASTSSIDRADTSWCLTHFPMLIKNCINKTPFNEIVSKNLYISVMLSIIVSIENKEECIILYHLENSYHNLVKLWVRIVKQEYVYALTKTAYSDVTISDILDDIKKSMINYDE